MRMEWSWWISQRRWDFFEYQAKKDPSQQLCDTVAELESGMEHRDDKRALKKVLYLLKQVGYEPTRLDKHKELRRWGERPLAAKPGVRGFMSAPDTHGSQILFFVISKAFSSQVVVFRANDFFKNYHCTVLHGRDDFQRNAIHWLKEFSAGKGHPQVEIHADYLASRIVDIVQRGDEPGTECEDLPAEVLTYANPKLVERHPALELPLRSVTDHECRTLWLQHPESARWRVWIGADHEIWTEIHAIRWDETWSEEEKVERQITLLLRERRSILDERTIANHAFRMRDMAYRLALQDNLDAEKFAAMALEIESRGPASAYFAACLEQTARDLPSLMEQDELEDENEAIAA